MTAKRFTQAEVERHPRCVEWVRSRDAKALEGQRDALQQKLDAIRARLRGEWDHPALVAIGPLLPDAEADILRILDGEA